MASLPASLLSRVLHFTYTAVGHIVVRDASPMRVRDPSMPSARFCSECGARFRVKRTNTLPLPSLCSECSPRYQQIRLVLIVVPLLCAVVGFVIGRYTSPPQPFYFIGTPVDLSAEPVAAVGNATGDHPSRGNASLRQPDQLAAPQSATGVICGAQTKSGQPCRRKVKGGGYCWQHRAGATAPR